MQVAHYSHSSILRQRRASSVHTTALCSQLRRVQEAEKNGAASEGTTPGKEAAAESPAGKQSETQPKQLDPGAYPGKESVGFFRESPTHTVPPQHCAQDRQSPPQTCAQACAQSMRAHICTARTRDAARSYIAYVLASHRATRSRAAELNLEVSGRAQP